MNTIRKQFRQRSTVVLVALTCTIFSTQSSAHGSDGLSAISTLSALPVASVLVMGGAVGTSAVGASVTAVALPVAFSVGGAVLIVKSIELSARGTICVLERASDGATATIEIAGRMADRIMLRTGQAVEVSVVGAGAVISMAGAAIAFVPNALGRALLHNERLTY